MKRSARSTKRYDCSILCPQTCCYSSFKCACVVLQTNAGNEPDAEDEQVCCEALEVMTLCFALLPTALDTLSKEKAWQTFIIDLLLHCQSKCVYRNQIQWRHMVMS